jgi:hypothetical protein
MLQHLRLQPQRGVRVPARVVPAPCGHYPALGRPETDVWLLLDDGQRVRRTGSARVSAGTDERVRGNVGSHTGHLCDRCVTGGGQGGNAGEPVLAHDLRVA